MKGAVKMSVYGPFKIVLAGDSATGKTSLLTRIKYGYFKKAYKLTIGGDILFFDLIVNQQNVRFMVWDSAGQSRFSYVRQSFYRGMRGFIIVFDITRSRTFENVPSWYYELKATAPDVPFVLVGNKVDLYPFRQIEEQDGRTLAFKYNAITYIETSAKTGFEAMTPFEKLAEKLILIQKGQERAKKLLTT